MNKLMEKARQMLGANERRNKRRRTTLILGVLVAALSTAALVSGAMAMTVPDTLSRYVTADSAVFWRTPGDGEDAWYKADGADAGQVDDTAQLRLRVAFQLPAGTLADGQTMYMPLPKELDLNDYTGRVFVDGPVAYAGEEDLVPSGTAEVKDDMLAVTFDDATVERNVGKDAVTETVPVEEPAVSAGSGGDADAGSAVDAATAEPAVAEPAAEPATTEVVVSDAVPAEDVSGYVDIDFDWSRVTTADDGTVTLWLNDGVWLDLQKYVEPAPAEEPSEEPAADEPAADEPAEEPAEEPATTDEPAEEPASTDDPATADDPATTEQPASTDDTKTDEATDAKSDEGRDASKDSAEATDQDEHVNIVQTPDSSSYAEFLPVSSAQAKAMRAPRRAGENGAASNDLSQYLNSGTSVMKLENGIWVPTTEVKEGDQIKVNLAYNFPEGVVTKDNRTFTYTVPEGVRPTSDQSGVITNPSGQEIGTYSIGTNGQMTVEFYESVASTGGAVVGSTTWQGTATLSQGQDSGTVHFGGAAADVKITKPEQQDTKYDIHAKKTGTLSEDHRTADYVVTVSTTKGTGDPVKISDRIYKDSSQNVNPSYDQGSLVIYKVSTDGSKTRVSGYTPNWNAGDANHPGFDVDNLPALNAGESYEVHYTVNVNPTSGAEVGKIANNAGGVTPKHNEWSWNEKGWQKNIQKTGTYNKETGLISWRIKVNTNGTDVNGTRVYDVLPNGLKLSGGYIVTCEDGTVIQNWSHNGESLVDYTFSGVSDEHKNKVFYIDFYTNAPEGDTTVNNTAQEWHGNNGYSSTGEIGVPVEHRTTDVQKTYKSDVIDGRQHKLTWDVDVTLPDSPISEFTFTDYINNATGPNDEDMGSGTHYALAYELETYLRQHESGAEGHLKIKINDYDYYIYGGQNHTAYENYNNGGAKTTNDLTIEVTYYDLDGKVINVHDNPNAKVSRFEVHVKPAQNFSKKGTHLTITDYPTHVDATNAGSDTWTVSNTGDINGKTGTDTHAIPNPKKLDKSAKSQTQESWGVTEKWMSDNSTALYDTSSGTIQYRVLLETTQDGTITLVGTMPAGMTYVSDSVYARYYKDDNTEWADMWVDNVYKSNFNGDQKPTTQVVSNADGTSTLTVTIPDFKYAHTNPMVAVYYKVSVKDDPYWQNGTNSEKTYTNSVTWNGEHDDNHTKVTRDVKTVDKSGVQLDKDGHAVQLDSNGNPTGTPVNKLRYYVDINPTGKDLDKNSDVLTLVDQVDQNDVNKYSPALDLSSVHLYAFDANADHHLGAEIDSSRYSVQFDAKTAKMTVKVPDGLACVLVYDYEINPSAVANGNKVTNNCSLNGNWSSKTETQLKESSSSSTAYKAKIELYKVDGDNYRKLLPGAVFKLEKWENSSWTTVSSNETVGTDGKLSWDLAGVDKDKLSTDTLYRLIETTAPEGYKKDATPHYFIWMSSTLNGKTTDAGSSWSQSQGAGAKKTDANGNEIGGLQQSDVSFFKNSGGIIYVPNTYTRVTVKKAWANSDGTPASAPSGASVKVGLYRYTQQPNAADSCAVTIVSRGTSQKDQGVGTDTWYQTETTTQVIKRGTSMKIKVSLYNEHPFEVKVNNQVLTTFNLVNGTYEFTVPGDYLNSSAATITIRSTDVGNKAGITVTDYTAGSMELSSTSRTKVGDSVNLNAGNSWTHNWDNLDATDTNGNKYFYRVEEENPGDDYDVIYTNNDGIQTGIITVTNQAKKQQGYVLPKTGSCGVAPFVAAGASAVVVALAGLRAGRLRHQG